MKNGRIGTLNENDTIKLMKTIRPFNVLFITLAQCPYQPLTSS